MSETKSEEITPTIEPESAVAEKNAPTAKASASETERSEHANPADSEQGADDSFEDEDFDSEDSLTFSNGVIEKIVALSVRDVKGVLGMKGGWVNRVQETFGAANPAKGVSVEVTPDNAVRVNVSVMIEYGAYAPQIFEDVKKAVVKQVMGMTGLEVAGVNLRIEDVLTAEEFEATRARREEDESEDAYEGE